MYFNFSKTKLIWPAHRFAAGDDNTRTTASAQDYLTEEKGR